jgi:hypothetical protein
MCYLVVSRIRGEIESVNGDVGILADYREDLLEELGVSSAQMKNELSEGL